MSFFLHLVKTCKRRLATPDLKSANLPMALDELFLDQQT